MGSAILETAIRSLLKLFSTNSSAASITNPIPTITAPTGNGIVDMAGANIAMFHFYGTRSAADNETFTARITAWRQISNLWIPTPLLALSLTQGTSIGIAAQSVIATEYFADTITASTAFVSSASYEITSPADNTIGQVKVDAGGAQLLQVQFAKGTNATCNGLASTF